MKGRTVCRRCGEPTARLGSGGIHYACEPTTCECAIPVPGQFGACGACHRLIAP